MAENINDKAQKKRGRSQKKGEGANSKAPEDDGNNGTGASVPQKKVVARRRSRQRRSPPSLPLRSGLVRAQPESRIKEGGRRPNSPPEDANEQQIQVHDNAVKTPGDDEGSMSGGSTANSAAGRSQHSSVSTAEMRAQRQHITELTSQFGIMQAQIAQLTALVMKSMGQTPAPASKVTVVNDKRKEDHSQAQEV